MRLKILFLGLFFLYFNSSQAKKTKRPVNFGTCYRDQYLCENQKCIERNLYCNGIDDCGDKSDESFCAVYKNDRVPKHFTNFWCDADYPSKYIPAVWRCDGVLDCKSKRDEEKDCSTFTVTMLDNVEHISGTISAREKAVNWLRNQRQNVPGSNKWGVHAPRIAVALYLADSTYFDGHNVTGNELAYEVDTQVLVKMLQAETDPVSMNELALYVHALLVTCSDPRDFHGVNVIAELRRYVDSQEDYVSPFVLLTLCNAKDKMTRSDADKLMHAFNHEQRTCWMSTQAVSLMALACIDNATHGSVVDAYNLTDLSTSLKLRQSSDGSFENIYTTALVIQALFASDTEDMSDWNMTAAIRYLVENQKADGTYGNLLNTYFTVPVLHYNSVTDISAAHCPVKPTTGDVDGLEELGFKLGKKMSIKYTLWFGDKIDLAYSMEIRVVENTTLFDVMRIAKALDKKYDFSYTLLNLKPCIYQLSGHQDDPETEKYWFLYKANATGYVETAIDESPIDVVPKDKEEYIMWYRSGRWIQKNQALLEGRKKEIIF